MPASSRSTCSTSTWAVETAAFSRAWRRPAFSWNRAEVLGVVGRGRGGELLVEPGRLLVGQRHAPGPLDPLELVVDLVLGLDQVAVLGVEAGLVLARAGSAAAGPRRAGASSAAMCCSRVLSRSSAREDLVAAPLEVGDPVVAGRHVEVVEAVAADRVVGGPALVEQPGGGLDLLRGGSSRPASGLLDRGELLVDLGERVGVAEADDVALVAATVRAAPARAGLAGQASRGSRRRRARPRDSTHSALREGSARCRCTQPRNGESWNSSLPATRSRVRRRPVRRGRARRPRRSAGRAAAASRSRSRSPPAGRAARASPGRCRPAPSRSPAASATPRGPRR